MSWFALRDKQVAVAPVVAVTTPMVAEPARSTPIATPTSRATAARARVVAKSSRDDKTSVTVRSSGGTNIGVADRAPSRAEAIAVPMAAPMPLAMRASGANAMAAAEREAPSAGLSGCYVVSRFSGDNAKSAGPPFADLPTSIQLTDSVATASGAATAFVAYGRSSNGISEQTLRWRAISTSAFTLTRSADPGAPSVRVAVDGGTGSEYVARRTSCP